MTAKMNSVRQRELGDQFDTSGNAARQHVDVDHQGDDEQAVGPRQIPEKNWLLCSKNGLLVFCW